MNIGLIVLLGIVDHIRVLLPQLHCHTNFGFVRGTYSGLDAIDEEGSSYDSNFRLCMAIELV